MNEGGALTEKRKNLIFFNILFSGIASSMLSTAMTTAMPQVTEYFNISISTGQWLTSGYSLAMGIIMPLTAFLITRFPSRKLYLSGLLCFIVGELVSIFAGNFVAMMIGRILQACGNGVLVAMAQVVILTIYPKNKKGTMMGWYGLATSAAPVIAPTLAGILVDTIGWKSIFVITMVIMIGSFLMAFCVFENVLELQERKFDLISFVESIFAFGGITLGITDRRILVVGLIAAVLFVYRQLHMSSAFLDIRILACKEYAISVVGSMLLYLVTMGGAVLMPLYVQTVLGYSATVSGLVTLPGSLASAIISPYAGKMYDKAGIRKLFLTGAVLIIVSNVAMFWITAETPLWIASALNVIRNLSVGCLMMPLFTWGSSHVKAQKAADASSLLTSLRTVAGSVGSVVFVTIMTKVGTMSASQYGDGAMMHGVGVSFLVMAFVGVIMFLMALFTSKEGKYSKS